MKITGKTIKYFALILVFSLFVTFFNLKLKKTIGLDDGSFGDTQFMYSMVIDLGIFYISKIIYYLIDFKSLI